MSKILSYVAIGICAAAVLCALLAVALPSWFNNGYTNVGLFRSCGFDNPGFDNRGFDNCMDTIDVYKGSPQESSIRACQAMTLLGFFSTIGALVVLILFLFVMKGRKMLGYIAGIVALVAGFLLMIGFAIFVANIFNINLGAGFAFCVLGWLASWGAGGFILFLTWRGMMGDDATPS